MPASSLSKIPIHLNPIKTEGAEIEEGFLMHNHILGEKAFGVGEWLLMVE